jgi:molecular chaperone DnaK
MARDNRVLGQFKLEGIRPAPRGMPQIEVTFDIDANGILNVSAKDRDTGKEQKITISGSTNLDKGEIERMVREAESHASEDRQRRQTVEERNEADTLAYQVEKSLKDLGDRVPAHEKARCEQLVNELRQAIKDEAPLERIRQLKSDLQQASYNLSAGVYSRQGAQGQAAQGGFAPGGFASGGNGGPGGQSGSGGNGHGGNGHGGGQAAGSGGAPDDEVIDADFTER